MIRVLSPTQAYREDLARARWPAALSERDAVWITIVGALEHALVVIPEDTEQMIAAAGRCVTAALEQRSGPGANTDEARNLIHFARLASSPDADREPMWSAYFAVIEDMTDAGLNVTSLTALAQIHRLHPHISPRLLGKITAHQGRVARQLGDLDAADEAFESVLALGHEVADAEIQARALYGAGGIALMRGNHPRARELYDAALVAATEAQSEELIGTAHRALMTVDGMAGDFDSAMRHASEGLRRLPGRTTTHAELLGNIGAVCSDAGHHGGALAAYVVAIHLGGAQRVRLSCLGGAALAASHLGDRKMLELLREGIEREIFAGAPPYESARVILLLAEAYERLGDSRAAVYGTKANEIATKYGFFELQFNADAILAAASTTDREPAPQRLNRESQGVLDEIVALAQSTDTEFSLLHHTMM